jgi:hypothetical protein
MGSACIFLDCVPQSDLAGRCRPIDGEPLAIDRDGIDVGGGIAHRHRTHMDIETEQYPTRVRRLRSLSEPRGKADDDNSDSEKPGHLKFLANQQWGYAAIGR